MNLHASTTLLAAAVLAALPLAAQAASPTKPLPVAKAEFQPKTISWTPQVAYRSATLRISGPGGFVLDRDFAGGKPVFDLSEMPYLADGKYVYEIVLGQVPDEALAKAVSRAEFAEDGSVPDAGLAARIAALRATFSGTFTIADGKIVSPYLVEAKGLKDQVIPDDLIVQGSICAGFDCVNNEVFGFDTLRLKENNTRIGFADTSTGTFPANAWQLTANDSASGGANKFSIEDITGAKVPFTVTAGAPTDSLFISSTGRVGFRTATPVLDLHARTGNTPGIRLEQDSSGGFTAQTWDIAGNEANFFIRDVTGGSRLPFRIRPGAPTSSVDIAATGSVGIGTSAPDSNSRLHVASGVLNLDDGFAVAWGGGSFRPALLGNKASQYFAMYTQGLERLRVDGSGNVGVGTTAPDNSRLHVSGGTLNLDNSFAIAWGGGTSRPAIVGDKSSGHLAMFTSGAERMRIAADGKVTITGQLAVTGPCCGPDYVFSPGFKIASIEENAAYMWKNRHLPAVGPARTTEDGRGVVDVFRQSNGMLEELEKAHIYIEQLQLQIKALRAEAQQRDTELRRELAELRNRLAR